MSISRRHFLFSLPALAAGLAVGSKLAPESPVAPGKYSIGVKLSKQAFDDMQFDGSPRKFAVPFSYQVKHSADSKGFIWHEGA